MTHLFGVQNGCRTVAIFVCSRLQLVCVVPPTIDCGISSFLRTLTVYGGYQFYFTLERLQSPAGDLLTYA